MALKGPWGIYYHIPKTGGFSARSYLKHKYDDFGIEIHPWHGTPTQIPCEKGLTAVRHPVDWLVSYYTYTMIHKWVWPDLPSEMAELFRPYNGLKWPDYLSAILERDPGIVGKVYTLYTLPHIEVFKIESVDIKLHETDGKPSVSKYQYTALCYAEREVMDKYGYD